MQSCVANVTVHLQATAQGCLNTVYGCSDEIGPAGFYNVLSGLL